jgi:hypothetical protein
MRLVVTTLHLRSPAADSPALRLRAARELQGASLEPPGLPPAALLIVRRVADPLPGGFVGDRLRPRSAWEWAVRDALADAARRASRPDELGRPSSSAAAVLFADEAELLACLIADRIRGEAEEHWWWRAALSRLELPALWAREHRRDPAPFLTARPRAAPGAIALLARWGETTRLATTLEPAGATAAAIRLAMEYALPLELVTPPATHAEGDGARGRGAAGPEAPNSRADGMAETRPPWSPWLPAEVEHHAPPEVQCLLGVALGLHAGAGRLRSEQAVSQAGRWWRERARLPAAAEARGNRAARRGAGYSRSSDPSIPDADRELGSFETPAIPAIGQDRAARPFAPSANPAAGAGVDSKVVAKSSHGATANPDESDRVGTQALVHGTKRREHRGDATPPTGASGLPGPRDGDPSIDKERAIAVEREKVAPGPTIWLGADGTPTRIGGVLYLIHALDDLGLPTACEDGWSLSSTAGPWGTLDLVSRALIGRAFVRFARDPLWDILAKIAGSAEPRSAARRHAQGPTSSQGTGDPVFRLPPALQARLADGDHGHAWSASSGRVWVWSRAGFLVAHRRCRGDACDAARRELARIHTSASESHLVRRSPSAIPWSPPKALPSGCAPRLGRLAAALAPAVRRRLLLALGERGAQKSIAHHLAIPGRLYVTSSHVDLVMGLDRISVAVRHAGLDRDPGWLPAYGRVVSFHFQ